MWVSTSCRRAGESPAGLVARLASLGAQGIVPAGRLSEKLAAELTIALLPSGLRVPALVAPYPAGRGRRQPYLATPEKDERDAAIAETLASLGAAADLGAGVVIVALGELPVEHEWSKLVRAFERGEDVEDRVDRARNLRRRMSERALDLARFGLERVLGRAADLGLRLAVPNRTRWWELPQGTELATLVREFRGAPLSAWIDPAAAHAREVLGFPEVTPPPAELTAGAWLCDAAGLRAGLPWGRGEVDPARVAPATLRVHHVAPDTTDEELLGAFAA